MAGGTPNHNSIAVNIASFLNFGLREKNCRVFSSDLKVAIQNKEATSFVYPDGMVICGALSLYPNRKDAIINPILVIEVLSPYTESYDRGEKFHKYCSLDSFKEYVLVSSDKPMVETFYKENDTYWRINTAMGLDSSIYLYSIDYTLELKDIYLKVDGLKGVQMKLDL